MMFFKAAPRLLFNVEPTPNNSVYSAFKANLIVCFLLYHLLIKRNKEYMNCLVMYKFNFHV